MEIDENFNEYKHSRLFVVDSPVLYFYFKEIDALPENNEEENKHFPESDIEFDELNSEVLPSLPNATPNNRFDTNFLSFDPHPNKLLPGLASSMPQNYDKFKTSINCARPNNYIRK